MHRTDSRIDIKDISHEELVRWLSDNDLAPYRADQIFKWIYIRQADTFEVMTDLAKDIRQRLAEQFTIGRMEIQSMELSRDGSRKYLFRLQDSNNIEAVLIPEKDHYTLCISSQAGCAQGCRFCMTASGGFVRNLTAGEIIGQVRDIARDTDRSKRLTNIVFMGMGEPLANYRNVVNAISVLTNGKTGMGFSTRRITVSTAGIVPRIADLGRDTSVSLAISLNAADNKTRDRLMPINRKYPIEQLIEACRHFPLAHRRRITIEYILIRDINDSQEDAKRLAGLLRPVRAKINLIPFNEHPACDFHRPEESAIQAFKDELTRRNYTVMVRYSKGQDISAACGQLSANAKRSPAKEATSC